MAIFGPRKPLNLAYFRGFRELYCSKLLQIWFVNVFLLVLTKYGEKMYFFFILDDFVVKIDHFLEKVDFLPVHEKSINSCQRPDIKL